MRGRKTTLIIELESPKRAALETIVRSPTSKAGQARRARAILLLADKHSFTETARLVGMAERHVRKWTKRFQEKGLAGLEELPGRGRKPVFPPRGSGSPG